MLQRNDESGRSLGAGEQWYFMLAMERTLPHFGKSLYIKPYLCYRDHGWIWMDPKEFETEEDVVGDAVETTRPITSYYVVVFPVGFSHAGALEVIGNKRASDFRIRGELRQRVWRPSLLGC